MTEVALIVPLAEEQRLVAEAPRHGHRVVARCSGADQLSAKLSALVTQPELVVVAASAPYLTAEAVSVCDEGGLRLIVVAASEQERRYAASLGIADPISAPFEWALLRGASAAQTAQSAHLASGAPTIVTSPGIGDLEEDTQLRFVRPVPGIPIASDEPSVIPLRSSAPSRGSIIAVWGPEGAPGRTRIAIELAAEWAQSGTRVALADADTHAAAVAPALGLLDEAPGFAAACRLAASGALDRRQFERIAQSHRAGRAEFQVLTGIGRPSRWPELTAARIAGVLSAARDWVEVTVVDVAPSFEQDDELMSDLNAPRRHAATIEVLRSADRVIAVGAADPVGLSRFLRGHAELSELVDPHRVITVINKLRSGAIGMGAAAQVRQTLARFGGIDDAVLVPWDLAAFDAALLSGRTLVDAAPRSAARAAIRQLASQLRAADSLAGLGLVGS